MTNQLTPSYVVFDWAIVGGIVVARALPGDISNDVWNRFLEAISENNTEYVLTLALGSPSLTATQRKAAADLLKRKSIPAAVVTESPLVRGIVTAVSWLGAKTKSFSWKDLDQAVEYCGVMGTPAESELREVIAEFVERRKAAKI